MKVNLITSGFKEAHRRRLEYCAGYLKFLTAEDWFKERILNHRFQGKLGFANTNLNNFEVYEAIMNGAEVLDPEIDHEMDIYVKAWWSLRKIVGYTYPNIQTQYFNTRYFKIYSDEQIAANLAHEWTHKLGFGHDYYATPSRPYSVPYAVGSIIAKGVRVEFLKHKGV